MRVKDPRSHQRWRSPRSPSAASTAVPAVAGPAACDNRNNNTSRSSWSASRWPGSGSTSGRSSRSPTPTGATGSPGYPGMTSRSPTWWPAPGGRLQTRRSNRSTTSRSCVLGPSTLEQTAPADGRPTSGRRLRAVIDQSDPGDVTAAVTAVRPAARASATPRPAAARPRTSPASRPGTSPCSSAAPARSRLKAENAAAAGAVGVVIFNQGNTRPDRQGIPAVTLRPTTPAASRCIGTTYAWARTGGHGRPR